MRPIELTSVCDRLTDSVDSEDNFNYQTSTHISNIMEKMSSYIP